jgi:hypothetical protein
LLLPDQSGSRVLELATVSGGLAASKSPWRSWKKLRAGRDTDSLKNWISQDENAAALLLDESVDAGLVQRVVSDGYADDLTDDEVEKLGRDPFLIAYGLADPADRCIVRTEVSKPRAQRRPT